MWVRSKTWVIALISGWHRRWAEDGEVYLAHWSRSRDRRRTIGDSIPPVRPLEGGCDALSDA